MRIAGFGLAVAETGRNRLVGPNFRLRESLRRTAEALAEAGQFGLDDRELKARRDVEGIRVLDVQHTARTVRDGL